jgi:hypothetical protein
MAIKTIEIFKIPLKLISLNIDYSSSLLCSKTEQYLELNEVGRYFIKLINSESLSMQEVFYNINHEDFKLNKNNIANFLDKLIKREMIFIKG